MERQSDEKRKPRFRFSLRALLLFLLMTAITVVGVQQYLRYVEFRDSTPIEVVLENFNNRKKSRYDEVVGDGRTPLTTDEVIAYLKSDAKIIADAPPHVKSIFRRIVNTRRIPNGVEFDFMSLSSNRAIEAWLVGMEIDNGSARYRINIRKMDVDPATTHETDAN